MRWDMTTRRPLSYWCKLGLFGLSALLLALTVASVWLARQRALGLVHPARLAVHRSVVAGSTQWRDVSFDSQDGLALAGWYKASQNGATVILVHGLANNREGMLDQAKLLADHGYGVVLFDLRNHGESAGEVTTLGFLEVLDVGGAIDFVAAQPAKGSERIGLLGHSMGGATAILAAARYPQVAAVIAESTFTSVEDNVADSIQILTGLPAFPFAPLVVWFGERESGLDMDQVAPISAIGEISPRPILLVHGELDAVIPVKNVYRLYAAAGEPKELYVISNAAHLGLSQAQPAEYSRRIVGFFDRYLLRK